MKEWKILRVDPLPVVGRPSADLSHPHRWIELVIEDPGAPFPPGLRLETTAAGATLRCPAEPLREAGKLSLLAVVKDVASTVRASIRLLAGDRILAAAEFETGPVPHFEYHLMPSSHLCFGYFTGLPEHWEAFRSLRDAVQLISEDDHYTYNVEFLYGLKNLLHKRPQLQETVKRFIRKGRLDISPTLAPSYADFYEGESYIRQFAESQWWLRRRLGAQGRVLYSCDSPGFDPQMPQILDKCGISFFWRGRYGGIYPRPSGSQLLDVEGADGTRHPSFVPQEGVLAGYTTPTISALWRTDELIEGSFTSRSKVVRQTAASIRAVLAAWGAPYVGHAAARDQAESRRALINRVAAWNRSFVTPQARFNTLSRFSDRVASDSSGPAGSPPGLPAPLRAERPWDVPHHGAVPSSRLRPGGRGEGRRPRLLRHRRPLPPGPAVRPLVRPAVHPAARADRLVRRRDHPAHPGHLEAGPGSGRRCGRFGRASDRLQDRLPAGGPGRRGLQPPELGPPGRG